MNFVLSKIQSRAKIEELWFKLRILNFGKMQKNVLSLKQLSVNLPPRMKKMKKYGLLKSIAMIWEPFDTIGIIYYLLRLISSKIMKTV